MLRRVFLLLYQLVYRLIRFFIFRRYSAQAAHERAIHMLRFYDDRPAFQPIFRRINRLTFPDQPTCIGGVSLPYPVMLAAGFVKGEGFASEAEALAAVERGENIISGWRMMPALVGTVEFGSFTRYPRLGNPGTVIWRDVPTRSTQNRIGLRNPGARAAAAFFEKYGFPANCGINIAISPGLSSIETEQREFLESLEFFLEKNVRPSWFTLNLSCPNTEDDPQGNQTDEKARLLSGSGVDLLRPHDIPLWVKLGPDLTQDQYRILLSVFAEVGVKAVIATNTLAAPTPDNPKLNAGVGGGRLFPLSLEVARTLAAEVQRSRYPLEIIGCGGIQDRAAYRSYQDAGVAAIQYWSGLVYHGPLAGALLLS